MNKDKRYIFFLRHFNDIDNIAPAIYFFLEDNQHNKADIILYKENYDFENDRNLDFLIQTFPRQISIRWLGDMFGIPIHNARSILERKKRRKDFVKNIAGSFSLQVINIIKNIVKWRNKIKLTNANNTKSNNDLRLSQIRNGSISNNIIRSGLKDLINEQRIPDLVIFDVIRSYEVKGILQSLRDLNIENIICLPVSPLINYNVLRSEYFVDVFSETFQLGHDYSGFDALGYVDHHYVDSYNKFLPLVGLSSDLEGKTERLGSIRFCPEWLPIRERMVKEYTGNYKPGTRKIVFFLSHAASNVNVEEVKRTIQILNLFPQFTIVIKGHTREEDQSYFDEFKNVRFENSVDSTSLINWADIILFWSTSIAIEGYIKNKTMICLSYIVGNKNLYEKYDAGYVARCRDELVEALIILKNEESKLPYNQNGVEQFLNEIIWAKDTMTTVPNLYLKFMKKYERKT